MNLPKMDLDTDLQKTGIDDQLRQEIALFRAIKPYLGHCLNLNHDLNNPLAGVIGYAEFLLLDEDELTEDQKNSIQQILSCGERMKALLESLCIEKISLSEKIDLESVVKTYKKVTKPLD